MNRLLQQWWRLGGYFGIGFVVLFIVAIIAQQAMTGEPPSFDDPIQEIRAYWEDEGQGYLIADYLFALSLFLFFVPFVVSLRALLGAAEGGGQVFSRTAQAAGILTAAIIAAAATPWAALALGAENINDATMTALMYFDAAAWNAVPYAFALLVLAASLVISVTGVLWRWLGILGALVGVSALISPLWIVTGDYEGPLGILGFVAFIGLALWILATSIAMVLRKVEPAPVAPVAETETLA
jgi:hypothetical protein